MSIGPKTLELLMVLDELERLLDTLGLGHWSRWMGECARRLRQADFSGITHLLGAYGGMGSFNDVLPQLVDEPADPRADRARRLRDEAWLLAEAIRREVQAS